MPVLQNPKPKRKRDEHVFRVRGLKRAMGVFGCFFVGLYTGLITIIIIFSRIRTILRDQFELVDVFAFIFIPVLGLITYFFIIRAYRERLVVEEERIWFYGHGNTLFMEWEAIRKFEKRSSWTIIYRKQPQIIAQNPFIGRIIYSIFYQKSLGIGQFVGKDLPQSELGQAIAQYAPHLFEDSDDPKLKHLLLPEDDYDEQMAIEEFSDDEAYEQYTSTGDVSAARSPDT